MTGEVTLRGKVLAIGGLKAKTIAAHRSGIKTVLIPEDNARDIPELPERIKEDLHLITVSHLDEVLQLALMESVAPPVSLKPSDDEKTHAIIPPILSENVGGRPFQA